VPEWVARQTRATSVDWSDQESWAAPAGEGEPAADPDASWGRRHGRAPGVRDELFFGYYTQAVTTVPEEDGPAVPELVRRVLVTSAHVDPPPAVVRVFRRMVAAGITLGDVLADCGYSLRRAANWALPMRALGASLVVDLHPQDRGPQGTFAGAVIASGNLYCPATPPALLALAPAARDASAAELEAHDVRSAELARYKLAPRSGVDGDGYQRLGCPALAGKLRCPLREESMAADHARPQVLAPPDYRPRCCVQQTITVGPEICAKTSETQSPT